MKRQQLFIVDWFSQDAAPPATTSPSSSIEEDDEGQQEYNAYDQRDYAGERSTYVPKKYTIRLYCKTSEGQSVAVHVLGYEPYFYVGVPQEWSDARCRAFVDIVTSCMRTTKDRWVCEYVTGVHIVNKKPFYGFYMNDTIKLVKISFSRTAAFSKYANYIKSNKVTVPGCKPMKYQTYESKLEPKLRFMHEHEIPATGWIELDLDHECVLPVPEDANETTCELSYVVSGHARECIRGLPERQDIPPIKYVGFDIEADSSHGDFPISQKTYRKLAQEIVTQFNLMHERRLDLKLGKANKLSDYDERAFVTTLVRYAFDPLYSNYNIRGVILADQCTTETSITFKEYARTTWKPSCRDILARRAVSPLVAPLLEPDACGNRLFDLIVSGDHEGLAKTFHERFPPVATKYGYSYEDLASQLCECVKRQKRVNARAFTKDPRKTVALMLRIAFDPLYDNVNLSNVFVNPYYLRMITAQLLEEIVNNAILPTCQKAWNARRHELRVNGAKVQKSATVRKQMLDAIGESDESPINDLIEELGKKLDQQLPAPEDDPVIQIGMTFKRYGEKHCYLKHILCLNDTEPINNETLVQFEHDGVKLPEKLLKRRAKELDVGLIGEFDKDSEAVQRASVARQLREEQDTRVKVSVFKTERELLLAWTELIQEEDPDILVGYNIFGFDFKFLYERANRLGILEDFMLLGRMAKKVEELKEMKQESAGMGDNLLHIISTEGRVSIDMYKVMQRMHKLVSYKLDAVCQEFLHMQKVDVSPQEIFIKQRGTAAERREVAEYCLIDCVLCNRLVDKFEIITNNIGMARVCHVPFSYLFLRGQGIKVFSFVARECSLEDYVIIDLGPPVQQAKYEGAIVLKANVAIHTDNPTFVDDFNSLYPSCMIGNNLSHNSLIGTKVVLLKEHRLPLEGGVPPPQEELDMCDFTGKCIASDPEIRKHEQRILDGTYEGWTYKDIRYELKMKVHDPSKKRRGQDSEPTLVVIYGHCVCRWAQPPNGEKSIVPRILMSVLKQRKAMKKKRDEYEKGSFSYNLYEGLQLAYKVTANSMYGIYGSSTSPVRLRELAASTTATGRELINFSCEFVLNNYPGSSITYGDTDSIFCQFDLRNRFTGEKLDKLDAIYKGIELATEAGYLISEQLPKPHNLEFEKAIYPFVLFSKKRYHGHYYTKYGHDSFYVNSMGIVLKRRDNAPILKKVYGGMLDIIMYEHDVEKAVKFVEDECRKILRGQVDMEDLIISTTLRSYYADWRKIRQAVLAERIGRRDPGNKPQSNDRVPYVYIVNPNALLQGDRIESPEFIEKNKDTIKIDYEQYVRGQLQKPITAILELANADVTLFDRVVAEEQDRMNGIGELKQAVSTSKETRGQNFTELTDLLKREEKKRRQQRKKKKKMKMKMMQKKAEAADQ